MARPMKSTYMISATGRLPVAAAPTATAAIASSEIGVSRTRSVPNSSTRPLVTPKTPPPPQIGDVLAHDEHGRIAPHLLAQRLVERLGVGDLPLAAARLAELRPAVGREPVGERSRVDVRHELIGRRARGSFGRIRPPRRSAASILLLERLDLRRRVIGAAGRPAAARRRSIGSLLAPALDLFLGRGSSAGRRRGGRGSGRCCTTR